MLSDKDLVRSIMQGDVGKFEQLVEMYQRKVYGMIYSLTRDQETAKDLSQEAFIKIYQNINGYNPTYPLATWIYSIARNTVFDYIRKNGKLKFLPLDELGAHPETLKGDPAQLYEEKQLLVKLHQCIEQLPRELKEVFVLKYFAEQPYKEIAKHAGLPETTIQTRLFRARQILRRGIFEDSCSGQKEVL